MPPQEEAMLSQDKPVFMSDADIIAVAQLAYGITASVKRLPGEYDTNALLECADGQRFVIKIMHPSREASFVEMQVAVLDHIATHAMGIPVQRVLPQLSGVAWSYQHIAGNTHLVWMLTYVEGTLYADANPVDDALVGDLGRVLGQLAGVMTSFAHPATFRELQWDVLRGAWIREYLDALSDLAQQQLVTQHLQRFDVTMAVYGAQLRHPRRCQRLQRGGWGTRLSKA
jgi:Ser/Thr protein kinase RdoA (MazF antagonist)